MSAKGYLQELVILLRGDSGVHGVDSGRIRTVARVHVISSCSGRLAFFRNHRLQTNLDPGTFVLAFTDIKPDDLKVIIGELG